jgi:hypothetical protein
MAQNSTPTYDLFIKSYFSASFQKKSKEMQFRDGQKLWNAIKSDKQKLITTFQELKAKSADNKSTLLYFWKNCANTSTIAGNMSNMSNTSTTTTNTFTITANTSTTTANMSTTTSTKPRPAQEQTTNRLTEVDDEIAALSILHANGLLSSDQKLIHKKLTEERRGLQKKLKRLECEGAAEEATKSCAVDTRRTSTESRSR